MATYFITGGAGFLGINLTRYLLEKGHKIVSYDMSADYDYPEASHPDVEAITGDIRDYVSLEESMRGCDIVVHTAAALPLYSEADIMSTDVTGTENVLTAAKENNINRVVMISSTAVYGIPDHHPLLETDAMVGVGPYGKAKIAAEETCLRFRKEGMIIPVIRPKSFVGPERLGVFALFYDWANSGKGFPMIGSGNNKYQLLDVYDLCSAIYLTATLDENVVNDTFNVGAEDFTTMREDYQAVLDMAGYGKKIRPLPAAPVIWTLRVLEAMNLSPLYKWVYETASKDSFVSVDKAKQKLGWEPVYSNKDALRRNYKWYLDNVDSFDDSSGVSHRAPWKQGVLKFLKVFF